MTSHAEQGDVLPGREDDRAAEYFDFSSRTQIEIVGADRAKVLHGLCTNDIKRLNPGEGCEAFLTNIQGRTIAFVHVFCLDESIILETAPEQTDHIIASIDRYIIREDVELIGRTGAWGELLLSGERAAELLGSLVDFELPAAALSTTHGLLAGIPAQVHQVPFCAPTDFFLRVQATDTPQLINSLESAGAVAGTPEAVHVSTLR